MPMPQTVTGRRDMSATVIPFSLPRADPAQPTIDVLLPVYNAARTVESAVASVLAQTAANIRVIAVVLRPSAKRQCFI